MAVRKFTYSGDPASSDRDAVRFHAGDTDRDLAELEDEEIDYALGLQPDVKLAAAELLEALAAKYSRKANIAVGQVRKDLGSVADQLAKRAKDLRATAGNLAQPFFGGLTKSGKSDLDTRTDDVQPRFRRGQFDNPRAASLDDPSPSSEEQ